MANKAIFGSTRGKQVPAADTSNAAGGHAYAMTPQHALAQLAFTGTFNDTFYQSGGDQLAGIRKAADGCSPRYIAQCAVAAREQGYMKDMPAALAVMLSKADPALLRKVFPRIIDNGKQIRNFVQFIRSGAFGRKSLGTGPKKLVQRWLAEKSDYALFRASVGNDPSLADVIKMVHPKPATPARKALYAYLTGADIAKDGEPLVERYTNSKGRECVRYRYCFEDLPEIVQHYERFKKGETAEVPNVEFRMLTSLPLTKEQWAEIAKNGRWHQTRMNLNTYARQSVFEVEGMVDLIANRLKDPDQIRGAKVFPYQLLAAFQNTGPESKNTNYWGCTRTTTKVEDGTVPAKIRLALQEAMEIAVENVPAFAGKVCVIVDTSGSMGQSVTGYRKGSTSKVSCVDVAALVAATVQRKNSQAVLIPVDTEVHRTDSLNPMDSIMTNATKLSQFGGGGTRLGAAMQFIETGKVAPDLIIMVSDNESWVGDSARAYHRGTETIESFRRLQAKNPNLKMVCIDIVANTTGQTPCVGEPNILNIGGFSDQIWNTISRFVDNTSPQAWVDEIKQIDLDAPRDR